MAFCSFAQGAAMYDSTPIDNLFLTQYMPGAPEQYLKVYLYARMLALHPEMGAGLDDMAKALRTDDEAVLDAMLYWERQGLARRMTDRPPTFELLSVHGGVSDMNRDYYEYRDFHADIQALFPPDKVPHAKELGMAADWIQSLGFSREAVLLALKNEIGNSRSKAPSPRTVFERLNKKMGGWAERGLQSVTALEKELSFSDAVRDTAARVLRRFNLKRLPTEDELVLARKWLEEWQYAPEDVLSACPRTTSAQRPSFAYLDSVLKNQLSGDSEFFEPMKDVLKELSGGGATPTPEELAEYARFRRMGFEPETIRLAAVQNRRKGRRSFENVAWMLEKWQKLDLFRLEDAETYVNDMGRLNTRMRELLTACGLERAPRLDELNSLEEWQAIQPDEVIDYAAQCARGTARPAQYMDKLLREWADAGANTVEAAKSRREAHAGASKPSGDAANPALNYQQRDYHQQDEDSFFIDLEKEYGDGGDKA